MSGFSIYILFAIQHALTSRLKVASATEGAAVKAPDLLLVVLADDAAAVLLDDDVEAMATPPDDKPCVVVAAEVVVDDATELVLVNTVGLANAISPPGSPEASTCPPMYCSKSG